eukprot:5003326-Pleurochrysis_carterae.AAC.3
MAAERAALGQRSTLRRRGQQSAMLLLLYAMDIAVIAAVSAADFAAGAALQGRKRLASIASSLDERSESAAALSLRSVADSGVPVALHASRSSLLQQLGWRAHLFDSAELRTMCEPPQPFPRSLSEDTDDHEDDGSLREAEPAVFGSLMVLIVICSMVLQFTSWLMWVGRKDSQKSCGRQSPEGGLYVLVVQLSFSLGDIALLLELAAASQVADALKE